MNPRIKKLLSLVGALLALVALPVVCNLYFSWQYRHMAAPLIEYVEQYHKATGKFPKNAMEMGYNEKDLTTGPFYRLIDSTHYNIYYTDGAGSFYTYNSHTAQWTSVTQ